MARISTYRDYRRVAYPVGAFAILGLLHVVSCGRGGTPPTASKVYSNAVRAFHIGSAALEAGNNDLAKPKLAEASRLAPDEPAIWANLGIMAIAGNQFDVAAERLEKARALAPSDSRILFLLAILESRRGRSAEAIAGFRKVLDKDTKNLRARFAIFKESDRLGAGKNEAEAQRLLTEILEIEPDNLVALTELARLAAMRRDTAQLRTVIARLENKTPLWSPKVLSQYRDFKTAAEGNNPTLAATQAVFLQNVLKEVPSYRHDYAALDSEAKPLMRLVTLPNPPATPAPSLEKLSFRTESLSIAAGRTDYVGSTCVFESPILRGQYPVR